jgi:DNA-binding CsgD family transcriptional regulator
MWAEAIDCRITLGAGGETFDQAQVSDAQPGRASFADGLSRLDSASQVALAALGQSGGGLGAAAGLLLGAAASIRNAAPSASSETGIAAQVTTGVIAHLFTAYRHHQGNDTAGVGRAVAAAIQSGAGRQQVSGLVDFIDVHIRPMLQGDRNPLGFPVRDVVRAAPAREAVAARVPSLNHREMQVLQRICEGYKNREISEQLGLELSTIKWYSTRIYEKLQVRNRTQAVVRAQSLKLFG